MAFSQCSNIDILSFSQITLKAVLVVWRAALKRADAFVLLAGTAKRGKKSFSCFVVWCKVFKQKKKVYFDLYIHFYWWFYLLINKLSKRIVVLHKWRMPLKSEKDHAFILHYCILLMCEIPPRCGEKEDRISMSLHMNSDRAASNTFIKYKRSLYSAVMLKYLEN